MAWAVFVQCWQRLICYASARYANESGNANLSVARYRVTDGWTSRGLWRVSRSSSRMWCGKVCLPRLHSVQLTEGYWIFFQYTFHTVVIIFDVSGVVVLLQEFCTLVWTEVLQLLNISSVFLVALLPSIIFPMCTRWSGATREQHGDASVVKAGGWETSAASSASCTWHWVASSWGSSSPG